MTFDPYVPKDCCQDCGNPLFEKWFQEAHMTEKGQMIVFPGEIICLRCDTQTLKEEPCQQTSP